MRGFLLDTNVVSEFDKPRASATVLAFVDAQPRRHLYTSDIVLAELRCGAEELGNETPKALLLEWIDNRVRPTFGRNIVPTGEEAFLLWRRLVRDGRRSRMTYSEPDTLLAATAQVNDLIVVTRDWKPFDKVGTKTLDPWKGLFRQGYAAKPSAVDLTDNALLAHLGAL